MEKTSLNKKIDAITIPKLVPKGYPVMLYTFTLTMTLPFFFSDTRKLGKIALVDNIELFVAERRYGKDALSITGSEFVELIQKKKMAIKTALMDQKIVAGVGNEFSDEILFETRIHPGTPTMNLSANQLKSIYAKWYPF